MKHLNCLSILSKVHCFIKLFLFMISMYHYMNCPNLIFESFLRYIKQLCIINTVLGVIKLIISSLCIWHDIYKSKDIIWDIKLLTILYQALFYALEIILLLCNLALKVFIYCKILEKLFVIFFNMTYFTLFIKLLNYTGFL